MRATTWQVLGPRQLAVPAVTSSARMRAAALTTSGSTASGTPAVPATPSWLAGGLYIWTNEVGWPLSSSSLQLAVLKSQLTALEESHFRYPNCEPSM